MNNITEIKKGKYQGYLWYSNENTPRLFNNELLNKVITLENEENPFIIEGQLCDEKYSYSIKYVDGHYLAYRFLLAELSTNPKDYTEYKFIANRANFETEILYYIFRLYWKPIEEINCANNMEVLQPSEFVFLGIKK